MSRKLTTKEFIEKGVALFGRRYDYSESVYVNAHTDLKIKCRKHGDILITPNKHLRRGGGCKQCKTEQAQKRYVMPIHRFIEKCIDRHGERFDYSNVHQFKNYKEKIKIICKECGKILEQTPNKHLNRGQGCSSEDCKNNYKKRLRISFKDFLERAQSVHGKSTYQYTETTYKGIKSKIKIACNLCGNNFLQTADAHLHGKQGCPSCGDEIRQLGNTLAHLKEKGIFIQGLLYVIQCFDDSECFFKIGITKRSIKHRYAGGSIPYDFEVITELPIGLVEAYQEERNFLNSYKNYSYQPNKQFGGGSECFLVNPIEIDTRLKEIHQRFYPDSI